MRCGRPRPQGRGDAGAGLTASQQEFDRQVDVLVAKGYPALGRVSLEEFAEQLTPLRARLDGLPHADETRIPFVLVITRDVVQAQAAMERVELGSKRGFVDMNPTEPDAFEPIGGLDIPQGPAYLITEVDTGRGLLDVTPDDALPAIQDAGRSPLTIEEGVAVLTQHPDVLKERNAFSLLGSRRADKRVPALWVSRGSPRLGWCWAGNPHSWLGSASCAGRLGP